MDYGLMVKKSLIASRKKFFLDCTEEISFPSLNLIELLHQHFYSFPYTSHFQAGRQ